VTVRSSLIVLDQSLTAWRAARIEDGNVQAISIVPTALSEVSGLQQPLDGDVFLGRVRRMAPELGGCFVDLGRGEMALMPLEPKQARPSEGEAVIVEVTRAARASKGPRVSRHITLTGRWPTYEALVADSKGLQAPCPIHLAGPAARALAEVCGPLNATTRSAPTRVTCPPLAMADIADAMRLLDLPFDLQVFAETGAPFELLGVEAAIAACLGVRVDLAGGAYLLIEPTSALTAIDVNAGTDGRERVVINKGAATEIARQISLRDLGGHIVIDFIAARDAQHLGDAVKILTQSLATPGARTRIIGPSALGLVEIERRRRNRGIVGDARHYADRSLRQAEAIARTHPTRAIKVTAGQAVYDWLKARPALLAALSEQLGRTPKLDLVPGMSPAETRVEDVAL
jgi:Ribonuclease G/E